MIGYLIALVCTGDMTNNDGGKFQVVIGCNRCGGVNTSSNLILISCFAWSFLHLT
jgi:hypothetical protein